MATKRSAPNRSKNKGMNGRKNRGEASKGKRSNRGKAGSSKSSKRGKNTSPRKGSPRKSHGNKRKSRSASTVDHGKGEEAVAIDPYEQIKHTVMTNPKAMIRLFIRKLEDHPVAHSSLGNFGEQLQSSMINFSRNFILPHLMKDDDVEKMRSIINDRKLIYFLRQSFIRWLIVHSKQMKLLFKRKGEESAKSKIKYKVVVTRNDLVQKLSSTLHPNDDHHDVRAIVSKLDVDTKLKYFHFLKSDLKNPFMAQLTTPIPSTLLPNTQCVVPSLSGIMPNVEKTQNVENAIDPMSTNPHHPQNHVDNDGDGDGDEKDSNLNPVRIAPLLEHEQMFDNEAIQKELHHLLEGSKDCVLLSEKQILVDVLKTQYKLMQNAIDDYSKTRWMDAPIDHGHIRLMQREIIRDHEEIVNKCKLIETEHQRQLTRSITEVNRMRAELSTRRDVYLHLIENKCFRFLKNKVADIHEAIERKKQAIAIHEKKRENYLSHAKESLKTEQSMRKGVKLVEATYQKYQRQMTRAKTEYAVVEDSLQTDDFFALQEKLNALRNTNDRLWYWFKKEKEVWKKSINAFKRMNRFFKRIETFLIKEYGEDSNELMHFKRSYYHHVLEPMDSEQVHSELNKEIFEKKGISDIEMVYAMKKSDIKFPVSTKGVVNRLYSKMRPKDAFLRQTTGDWDGMFLNNEMKRDEAEEMENGNATPQEESFSDHDHSDDSDDDFEDEQGVDSPIRSRTDSREHDSRWKAVEPDHGDGSDVDVDVDDDDEDRVSPTEVVSDIEDGDRLKSARSSTKYSGSQSHHSPHDSRDDLPPPDDHIGDEEDAMPSGALLNMGQSFSMGPPEMDRGGNESGDDIPDVIAPEDDDDEDGGGLDASIWKQDVQKSFEAGTHIARHYSTEEHPLHEEKATDPNQLTYEDSRLYQGDEEEEEHDVDPNRPRSTVFRGDSDSPRNEQVFDFQVDGNGDDVRTAPTMTNAARSLSIIGFERNNDDEDEESYEEVSGGDDDRGDHGHQLQGDSEEFSFEDEETASSTYESDASTE